jgi:DNA-binding NarL/FixJ family response regulator
LIAVIESRPGVQEVIRRALQSALSSPVIAYSTASQLERSDASAKLVIVSLLDASEEACANALKDLSELVPGVPVVVLASENDVDQARTAFRYGAKGYIPCTKGIEIAVEVVRFVLAGGTYAPMDRILAAGRPGSPQPPTSQPSAALTSRELAFVRAIQQGKSNKVIARELNMSEGTVKSHVRNVMRKLQAKNRTDLAVRAIGYTYEGRRRNNPSGK